MVYEIHGVLIFDQNRNNEFLNKSIYYKNVDT